ncbi:MAG: Crp/Fnr family transcriptional regulator [Candidatus Binatia bacterium]
MSEQKRVGALSRLTADEIEGLLSCGTRRPFRVDEVVLEQGRMNASLFIVVRGVLHVRRMAERKQVLLGRLEAGSFFGEVSLFDPGATTAAVVGASNGELVEIRREHLDAFGATQPAALARFLTGVIEEMARRLRRTDDRLVEAIFWGGLMR